MMEVKTGNKFAHRLRTGTIRSLYSSWDTLDGALVPGYTILIPMPGDLPFLLRMALETIAAQTAEHLVEILVIPDQMTTALSRVFAVASGNWSVCPIRLLTLKPFDKVMLRCAKIPHLTHWLQMIRGVQAVRTEHALLHDIDLFFSDPHFLKTHYEECLARNLACLGVGKAWNDWYEQHGIDHLTATWELMFAITWFKSFAPWEHRSQNGTINGQPHGFDTTWLPQYRTPADRIGRHPAEWSFIHFNYVIVTYRLFQHRRAPFEDNAFRLLLLRLFIDAYDPSDRSTGIPPLESLVKGITDPSKRVTYLSEQAPHEYPIFRAKLQRLMESGLLNEERASIIQAGIQPFDQAFAYR